MTGMFFSADVFTVDMDGCLDEPMRDYWQRFPNATVHADVFYLEWGSEDVMIVVSEEPYLQRDKSGAVVITDTEWVIGVYPKHGDEFSDESVWVSRVRDERVAVGTLHFLTEVI